MKRAGLLDHFSALEDPRQSWKTVYPLPEILLLVLCGVMAGADDFVEIARWGERKITFLRRFLPFREGVPSHDTLNDEMNALPGDLFAECFAAWVADLRDGDDEIVAIDGKTSRRAHGSDGRPLRLVSAWAARQRLVLGQEACEEKENEIIAIPRLLARLELCGALVTIDAMGCQHGIAETILDAGADYLLALKANQKSLHDEVRLYFDQAAGLERFETLDADHGRLETRRAWVSREVGWLRSERAEPGVHRFPGLVTLGMVEAEVEHDGRTRVARRYFLSSSSLTARQLLHATRAHWGIENRLHWVMDVVLHDDLMRLRTRNGPANMATIRHAALNIFKRINDRASMKVRRKTAAWDENYLFSAIKKSE